MVFESVLYTETRLRIFKLNRILDLEILSESFSHRNFPKSIDISEKEYNEIMLPPYNWKTYGNMNVEFWKKHQNTSLDNAKSMFQKSHREVIKLAESFSNEELFSKGIYQWVGGSTLGSYFVSNTSSHYNWAINKLKAHIKNCAHM